MTDHLDDEQMDQRIRALAADYHQPPAVTPRDEMWTAIQAARSAPARSGEPDTGTTIVPPRRRRWIPTAAGIAAALLVGVAIGRYSSGRDAPPAGRHVASSATAPGAGTSSGTDTPPPGSAPSGRADRSAPAASDRSVGSVAYDIATVQHLGRVEALLTSFRAQNADARSSTQVTVWARDLLSTTRLLLDSPAGDDPRRRRLLEDLELVLVQMVQLDTTTPRSEERSLIERSLENDDMMTRLRNAIPAGAVVSGA